jgi:hypothetical protein
MATVQERVLHGYCHALGYVAAQSQGRPTSLAHIAWPIQGSPVSVEDFVCLWLLWRKGERFRYNATRQSRVPDVRDWRRELACAVLREAEQLLGRRPAHAEPSTEHLDKLVGQWGAALEKTIAALPVREVRA